MSPVVALTQTLVRIPSVNTNYDPASPGAHPVGVHIEAWAKERGFEVERFPVPGEMENLVLRLTNGEGPHLLYNGHIDTVSIAGMTEEPFSAELRDGKLWGRGSCDMKGPVAAMLIAAEQLNATRESWRGTLTLAFTPDEEAGTAGIRALVTQIPRPDFAVVGEPSSLKPLRGCKGSIRFILRAHGRAAHSSRPERGRSAIVAMARAILALQDYFRDTLGNIQRPQFGPSTGSIGLISGGTGINIVPAECAIRIDIRLIPGQDPDKTLADLQNWFTQAVPEEEGIHFSFEVLALDPSFEIDNDHLLTRTVCELTDTEAPDVAFFCCDASKIAAVGIPVLILGPGDIAQAHTAAEFVEISQLEQGVETYVALARRLLAP